MDKSPLKLGISALTVATKEVASRTVAVEAAAESFGPVI